MTSRSSPGSSEVLLPCPFCGGADVGFGRTGQKWQTVACNECGAEGPCTEIDRDLIIEKWNTRNAGVAQAPVPAAWLYEMAFYIKPSDPEPFKKWKWVATIEPPPTIPKDGVRNVHPLYTSVPSTDCAIDIPEGVYFSAEASNFYHVETKRGCGNDFYRIWKDHWRAFPQSEAAVSSNQREGK